MTGFVLGSDLKTCIVCKTHFVHNVAATVSYDRKELLDIRTAMSHLELVKIFSLMSLTPRIYCFVKIRPKYQSSAGRPQVVNVGNNICHADPQHWGPSGVHA
jgi:hypothetical protein